MSKSDHVVFREVQRAQYWIWAIVLPIAAFIWYAFVQQVIFGIPIGSKPAPNGMLLAWWIAAGVVLPVIAWQLKLETEVRPDGLYVRLLPFQLRFRSFPASEIRKCVHITYSPFRRFGGWGIRINFSGERAYTMRGNEAVQIQLASGQVVVIGSQRSEELLGAIRRVCGC
jgi:hypothetical protein